MPIIKLLLLLALLMSPGTLLPSARENGVAHAFDIFNLFGTPSETANHPDAPDTGSQKGDFGRPMSEERILFKNFEGKGNVSLLKVACDSRSQDLII